jgi:hypothetical protein
MILWLPLAAIRLGCNTINLSINLRMKILHAAVQKLKAKLEGIGNRKFKVDLLNALPFWTAAFITGMIAVLYAKLFALAESGTAFIFHKASWAFFCYANMLRYCMVACCQIFGICQGKWHTTSECCY